MDITNSLIKELLQHTTINFLDSIEATQKYGKTTFSPPIQLDGALVVNCDAEISDVLQLANTYQFNLYPISTNKNWGYGSFSVQKNRLNYILDLGQMTKITPTSKELGLITIEPGVTQQKLFNYLKEHNWQFMVPVTGAGPECSILSNAVERGYGITPHNDHFYAVTALKGYIPHPELCVTKYESAISAIDKQGSDFIDKTYKWGLGPYLDGLFTQSNLGIVSEMTIRLAPIPAHFSSFYIQIFDEQKLEQAVSFVSNILRDYSGIIASVNLMDQRRLISITTKNPNGANSEKVLSDTQIALISKQKKLPKWMIVGSIYSDKELVKVLKRSLKKRAKELGIIFFSDSLRVKIANKVLKSLPFKLKVTQNLLTQIESLQEGTNIMQGIPNQVALPLPYWRNPKVNPDKSKELSPAEDGCGLLWYAPLIKMSPSSLREFTTFIRETTPKYHIEPLITFTNLKHDCVDSTVPIVFNLGNEIEIENAHECLNELIIEGAKRGYVPYRLDIKQQQKLDGNHVFWQTTSMIKEALDPNHILAPQRYNPK